MVVLLVFTDVLPVYNTRVAPPTRNTRWCTTQLVMQILLSAAANLIPGLLLSLDRDRDNDGRGDLPIWDLSTRLELPFFALILLLLLVVAWLMLFVLWPLLHTYHQHRGAGRRTSASGAPDADDTTVGCIV